MRIERFEKWSLLAGFRFLLALIVAVGHLGSYSSDCLLLAIAWLNPFDAILGFLLVSGYSVGSSFLKDRQGFLTRRIRRIYPIYLASVILSLVVWVKVFHHELPNWKTILMNLMFLNQVFTDYSIVGPAWSLSLEFWLYCLVPFFFARSPLALRVLSYGSMAFLITYTAGRSMVHLPYFSNTALGLNLALLSFVWICGLRLSDPRCEKKAVFTDLKWFFIVIIGVDTAIGAGSRLRHHDTAAILTDLIPHQLMHAVTLFVTYSLFKYRIPGGAGPEVSSNFLRILGDVAYPLYLVHLSVYAVAAAVGVRNPYLLLASAIAVAVLFYLVLDRYSQKRHLRHRSAEGTA